MLNALLSDWLLDFVLLLLFYFFLPFTRLATLKFKLLRYPNSLFTILYLD